MYHIARRSHNNHAMIRTTAARMIEQDRGKRSDDGASPSLSIKTTQSDERSEINLDADDVCDCNCGDSGARRNK